MTTPKVTVLRGDCVELMRDMDADSVDAIVTDPPYGIDFMGKEWDGFGTPHGFQTWTEQWAREAFRVLKPGGHLLAFGGTRMYHRLATGIEDAGFEVRDMMSWIYGSGFPKSHNLKGEWKGWGTALKPAQEPIVVARKPLIGTVAENVMAHGTGAINIDAGRIGTTVETWPKSRSYPFGTARTYGSKDAPTEQAGAVPPGRWPANVLFDEEAAAELDRQSGYSKSGAAGKKGSSGFAGGYDGAYDIPYGDSGGASRFFYVAKPGKKERNAGGAANIHPTVKPIALMGYLIKLVTPPGGIVLDPFLGSGSTACAAVANGFDCIGIEQNQEYADIAEARIAHWAKETK